MSGFCQGAGTPLFLELSAELTYPVQEGTSAGIFFTYSVSNAHPSVLWLSNVFTSVGFIAMISNAFTVITLFVSPRECHCATTCHLDAY